MPIYKDLWAWTFALSITGYPLIGIASAFSDNESLSPAFRAAVLALSVLCFIFVDRKRDFRFGSVALLGFAGLYLAKLWIDLEYGIDGADDAMLFVLITAVAPAILLAAATPKWSEINVALAIFTISALAVAAILWLDYTGADVLTRDPSDRIQLEKLNAISIGHTAVTALIASYVLLRSTRRTSARVGIVLVVIASLYTVYFAGARGPVMSLAACLVLFPVLKPKAMTAIWCMVLAAASILALALTDITPLLEKFNLATMDGNRSALERLDSISMSWSLFAENPWFGYGTQLPFWLYPHNLFMEVLQAVGIVGMAVFCVVLVQMYSAVKLFADLRLSLLPLLTTQFFVGAQFSGSIYGSGSLWIITTVLLFRANAIRNGIRQPISYWHGLGSRSASIRGT
ncbi:O-antigen ligase family protein [Mesorhizobium sp. STM 4661]|uniref:O-antigen ligase family protein n=1 Tax=Mesorhizobium sp. STM 4661 TaxID=1297570 RepID=UPI0002C005B1|nr:O-antigen ligase family protein [Mesorhizobium sp. STM 4661]CCV10203.1 membrane hypothetical protein [Mesorhizobium sp. STM 4661]